MDGEDGDPLWEDKNHVRLYLGAVPELYAHTAPSVGVAEDWCSYATLIHCSSCSAPAMKLSIRKVKRIQHAVKTHYWHVLTSQSSSLFQDLVFIVTFVQNAVDNKQQHSLLLCLFGARGKRGPDCLYYIFQRLV